MVDRISSISPVISVDREVMGGTPVFQGTRVPAATLLDYLKAGDALAIFLDDFPTVSREQAVQLLDSFKQLVNEDAHRA